MALQALGKLEETKHNVSWRKEIIQTRTKINGVENKIIIKKTNETKNQFFEKNKLDPPLARLTKKKKRGFKQLKMKEESLQLVPQK